MIAARIAALTVRLGAAGVEGPRAEAWLLLAAATGHARGALMAGALERLSAAQEARLEALVRRRATREPMAYILGEKEFWSLPFETGPAVLIPRPESESVIEAALAQVADRGASLSMLDLGTGSGCLLLALLSELPRALGLGIDQSADALAIARRNAERLGLAGRARFEQREWGAGLVAGFDLIVSNPPYVSTGDLARLEPEVRAFEPQSALIAGPDGLAAYRALMARIAALLLPGGLLAFEVGHDQGESVSALCREASLGDVRVHADLGQQTRVVTASRIMQSAASG